MKFIPHEEIKKKIQKIDILDQRQLEKTCLKMVNYLSKEDQQTIVDVDKLLVSLHRSVICIQRKKRKMIEKR